MKIDKLYSFNKGKENMEKNYNQELKDIFKIITQIDAFSHRTKESKEETKNGMMLYSPTQLNKTFKKNFEKLNWKKLKHSAIYNSSDPEVSPTVAYREMDFVKNMVGVEVQFGKYAFMAYDIFSKMPIFRNEGYINVGVEIVPMKTFANYMSTGVSYYEQIIWDLEARGVSNIDIPVLVIGIDA